MTWIFKPFMVEITILFIDDIIIYSQFEAEHAHHLWSIMQTLKDCMLYPKFSKCDYDLLHFLFLVMLFKMRVISSMEKY